MSKAPQSRRILAAEPYTQWEPGVHSPGSACGPSTLAAMMEYWHTRLGADFIPGSKHFGTKAAHINYIYSRFSGRAWGMSVRSFVRAADGYIRSASGKDGNTGRQHAVSVFNDMDRYKAEIDAGRPVALKFDKWFSFRWQGKYAYDYHWVLGTGYEEPEGGSGPVLLVHDNGIRLKDGGYRPGQERRIPYNPNQTVITMVSLNITGF
ncbi:C39 family peptidase [Paenibacillus typhae]|uniref:C39 family peptidase n=1 Tax=Paenibacillus typhae TaxID=1174501 RepID=UPI001C8EDF3D|nr:C39 family peptidase [Paenibacillus typhae]MBY0013843.1 C39 family peptidase [Paenibacillus typhae]